MHKYSTTTSHRIQEKRYHRTCEPPLDIATTSQSSPSVTSRHRCHYPNVKNARGQAVYRSIDTAPQDATHATTTHALTRLTRFFITENRRNTDAVSTEELPVDRHGHEADRKDEIENGSKGRQRLLSKALLNLNSVSSYVIITINRKSDTPAREMQAYLKINDATTSKK